MILSNFDPAAHGWARLDHRGFMATIGPVWEKTEGGVTRYALLTGPQHSNRPGFVHGGVIAALAEFALGMECHNAADGAPFATVQCDVHYLDGAELGAFLEVDCEVMRQTRSITFVDGRIRVGSRLVASARGVCKRRRTGQT